MYKSGRPILHTCFNFADFAFTNNDKDTIQTKKGHSRQIKVTYSRPRPIEMSVHGMRKCT